MTRLCRCAALALSTLLVPSCSSETPSATQSSAIDAGIDADAPLPLEDATGEVLAPADGPGDEAQPVCAPIDPSPGTGPGGYPLDGWTWTRHGVVLEDSSAGVQGGYIAPAACVVGDALHLWVTRKQGTLHRILHSVSTNGLTFAEPLPTSGLDGQDIIAYPTVVYDGSRFLMWYGSGSIDLAQSLDGVEWTMIASGVLKPGGDGAFDSLSVLYPNVVAVPTGFAMYYTGFDGQAFGVGRAESTDGTTWVRSPTEAVLTRGSSADFDNHAVAQPDAVLLGSRTLLWYGGYDTSMANPGPYRIGLAESADGTLFERKGVTLDLTPSGVEAWSTRDPAVVRWRGQWTMAYSAMGDDSRYRIAVAVSDTCIE